MNGILACDLVLPTLAENLALDEALLLQAEDGGPEVLRLWEWPEPAIVLGAGGKLADDVRPDADIPILRRGSGGGTVLLGRGCLLFSLILAFRRDERLADIRASYPAILEPLTKVIPGLKLAGTSDLVWHGRKVSGNAQQRKRDHVLHHGTLLYDFDVGQIERFLRMPDRQPEYRQQRPHVEFVANLPLSGEELRRRLRATWPCEGWLNEVPLDRVGHLVSEKYSSPEWIRRR